MRELVYVILSHCVNSSMVFVLIISYVNVQGDDRQAKKPKVVGKKVFAIPFPMYLNMIAAEAKESCSELDREGNHCLVKPYLDVDGDIDWISLCALGFLL